MKKSIAFMFDLSGTLNDVCEETAPKLIERIEKLRNKFNADKAYISISTLFEDTEGIEQVCDELKPFLTENIEIGLSYNAFGTYDYNTKETHFIDREFNNDKMGVFFNHYVKEIQGNQFVACFDDRFDTSRYLEYQNQHPLLCGVPYSIFTEVNRDVCNMMYMVSTLRGTEGIIEILDLYLVAIRDIEPSKIVDAQIHMPTTFDISVTYDLICNGKYDILSNFLKNGNPTKENYEQILYDINEIYEIYEDVKDSERAYLEGLLNVLNEHFSALNNEFALNRIQKLKRSIDIK